LLWRRFAFDFGQLLHLVDVLLPVKKKLSDATSANRCLHPRSVRLTRLDRPLFTRRSLDGGKLCAIGLADIEHIGISESSSAGLCLVRPSVIRDDRSKECGMPRSPFCVAARGP
jgi:hypothetical protein